MPADTLVVNSITTNASVKEGESISFTLSTSKAAADTWVRFQLTGTETDVSMSLNSKLRLVDAATNTYEVLVKKGETSAQISIKDKNDNIFEGNKTLGITVSDYTGNTYGVAGNQISKSTTILDDEDIPKVTLKSAGESVSEGSAGRFTINLDHLSSEPTTVTLQLNGSALELAKSGGLKVGSQTLEVSSSGQVTVTIPKLTSSVNLDINFGDDHLFSGDKALSAKIITANTNSTNLRVSSSGDDGLASIKVKDVPPTVSINVTDAGATVVEKGDIHYKISLSTPSTYDTVVKFSINGSATKSLDFSVDSSVKSVTDDGRTYYTITIPKNQTETTFTVHANEDFIKEGGETVTAAITSAKTNGVQLVRSYDDDEEDDHEGEHHDDDGHAEIALPAANLSATATIADFNHDASFDNGSGKDQGAVTEDANPDTLTATGKITVIDLDLNESKIDATISPVAKGETLGSLTIDADGNWSYSVDNSKVQYLGSGEQKNEVFTVASLDGTIHDITITITGTNDDPVATLANDEVVVEDQLTALSGQLASADVDVLGKTASYTLDTAVAGLTLNTNGAWSFDPTNAAYQSLAAGEEKDITVSWTVTDDEGATDSSSFTITITGTNDDPVATLANDEVVVEDQLTALSGQLASADVDVLGKTASYTLDTAVAGLTLNTNGAWSFDPTNAAYQSLAAGEEKDITVSWTVTDDEGATDSSSFTITITGTNDAAVIRGTSTGSITETDAAQSVNGTLTSSDVDGAANKFMALSNTAGNGGYGHFTMTEGGAWTYTMDGAHNEFIKDQKYTDSVTVKTADGTEKLISVTITGVDEAVQQPCDSEVPTISSLSISDATGIQNKYLNKDDEVTIKVRMSEDISVTGTPKLEIKINGNQVQSTFDHASGADMYFKYKILSGQDDANGISIEANKLTLSGGSIKDAAGNDAILAYERVGDNSNYMVDTTSPSGIKKIEVSDSKFKAELENSLSTGEKAYYSFDNISWNEANINDKAFEIVKGSNTKIFMKVEDLAGNFSSVKSYEYKKPVALDLDGDNQISYLDQTAGVTYQFSDSSELVSTAWVASNDGLLARQESNGSLSIVFSTQNDETDLQGLAKVYDTNHDQVFDGKDAGFNNFGVWQDADSDGVVDAGEFLSLADRGILSLSLTSDGAIHTAADGDVTIYGQTTYTMTDGSTGIAEDVAFAVSDVTSNNGNGVQDIYQIASIAQSALAIDNFSINDGDYVDLSAILNPTNSIQSTISMDQNGLTDSHSTITVNIGGVDYEVATLYGKEIGVSDALGAHDGGSSLSDALHGASWTDVVDVSSEYGGPASISAVGGALTNSYSNEAGDWTVQIKSGTATVDATNKQITFSSENAENQAVITTADGTAHELSNVDKILWH